MRTLISSAFISLDGVVEGPGGEPGYRNSGWTFKDVDFLPEAFEIKGREQKEASAILMGRTSYEAFSPVWPDMEDFVDYKVMPKYVVSTTLAEVDLVSNWGETTILRSLDEVAALKETEGGPIIVHGSASLNQALSDSRPDRPVPPGRLPAAARRGQAALQRHRQEHTEAEARRARGLRQRPAEERLRRHPLRLPRSPRRRGTRPGRHALLTRAYAGARGWRAMSAPCRPRPCLAGSGAARVDVGRVSMPLRPRRRVRHRPVRR